MTYDRAVVVAAEAIADGVHDFCRRYAPSAEPLTAEVRYHVAQALLDGELEALTCAVEHDEPTGPGERLALAAVRFRVVRRPFPGVGQAQLQSRPPWGPSCLLRLLAEPSRRWRGLGTSELDWFFRASPLRWKEARSPVRFYAPPTVDRLLRLDDGDRALVRSSYDLVTAMATTERRREARR